jgi:hypothetical protein
VIPSAGSLERATVSELERLFDIEIDRQSVLLAEEDTAKYWAGQIHGAIRLAVESVAVVANKHLRFMGEDLLQAKAKLAHGQWLRLFKGHPNVVADPLPFSEDRAEMLMKVARHPVLSNSEYVRNLPDALTTLYELSRLPEAVIERAILLRPERRTNRETAGEQGRARGSYHAAIVQLSVAVNMLTSAADLTLPDKVYQESLASLARDAAKILHDLKGDNAKTVGG